MDRSHGPPPVTPADYGDYELFSFLNVTDREVFDAIRGIKSETMGLDEISIRFLRLILSSILPCVTHTFNTVLTCSIFPEAWKMSKILPVSKILNPDELRDYRPFSVLLALSKALEVVMRDQMIRFIDGFLQGVRQCSPLSAAEKTFTGTLSSTVLLWLVLMFHLSFLLEPLLFSILLPRSTSVDFICKPTMCSSI
jgi:hypothetical protein